jgi:hypothetical protein
MESAGKKETNVPIDNLFKYVCFKKDPRPRYQDLSTQMYLSIPENDTNVLIEERCLARKLHVIFHPAQVWL